MAEAVLCSLNKRMHQCGLELHPEKTKIVYCKDYRRQESYPKVKFDFLGYSFQPRTTRSKKTGTLFLGFDCAVSITSKQRMAEKMRELDIEYLSHRSIVGAAQFLEPIIRGRINYYGKYRMWALNPVFQLLQRRLVMWARKRYKRYRTSINRAYRWLKRVKEQFPGLFYHWCLGFS
ncbi:MAG: group II intron maturase-specific domain-containing protein [Bacteroidota bacterium]